MAIIPQLKLFAWNEIETLGELERLRLVLEHMPDEDLMRALEKKRGQGRNDYPVRAVWNSLLAGIVFQHPSVESLRRELKRNAQLRDMCGFEGETPPAWVYTRFMKTLFAHISLVDSLFEHLVQQIREALSDFGRHPAMDSKAISSFAKGKNQKEGRDTPAGYRCRLREKRIPRRGQRQQAMGKDRQMVRLQTAPGSRCNL